MPVHGQMVKECLNIGGPHLVGMPLSMKQNELSCPVTIGGLSVSTEMPPTANHGQLVK